MGDVREAGSTPFGFKWHLWLLLEAWRGFVLGERVKEGALARGFFYRIPLARRIIQKRPREGGPGI